MTFLKPAENKATFAKVGLYGRAGSGKTRTAVELAIGLCKKYGLKRGVAMFDTEGGASYMKPLFDEAGIPFFVYDESRALRDLMGFWDEATENVDVIIVDSVTHVWRDAQKSYLDKLNEERAKRGKKKVYKLEFHHWGPIKEAWAKFTDKFLRTRVHAIVCGRAGDIYEYQKNEETGKLDLVTTGTRMATEKEMGYEPSLLIEMEHAIAEDKKTIVPSGFVVKDRWDKYMGQWIDYPNFKKLEKHFDCLNIGGTAVAGENIGESNSKELFDGGEDDTFGYELRQRKILAEETDGLLEKHFQGSSAEAKKRKGELMEKHFGTRSWTKLESTTASELRRMFNALRDELEPMEDVKQ